MTTIDSVFAREILDSRGNPTVEVEVVLEGGALGRAAVPSGASTGEREAVELRDGDKKRYLGRGVLKAVAAVNDALSGQVIGEDALDQALVDQLMIELDGTDAKKRLGANAILAVSLAVAKAAAEASGMPLYRYVGGVNARTLPVPFMNIINGGAHADNKLDPQEFMIVPHGFPTFSEALRAGVEVFHHLKAILKKKGQATSVGDEGGFAPDLASSEEALEAILAAIKAAGLQGRSADLPCPRRGGERALGREEVRLQEVRRGRQELRPDGGDVPEVGEGLPHRVHRGRGGGEGLERLGCAHEGPRRQGPARGRRPFVTNPKILAEGIAKGIGNSILIKVNQIGTLTETLDCVALAGRAGYTCMMSHRSGETEDATIADLAVATGCGQIKTGSASRTDRVAKYNQLLRIEEELGPVARYAGKAAIHPR